MKRSKNIQYIFLLCGLVFFLLPLQGQDPQFSQFYAAPLYLAPSFAGAVNGSRVSANYRDQWPGIRGKFVTSALSYDQNFPTFNSGFGFLAVQDRAGSGNMTTTSLGLYYAYDFSVSRIWSVRPGLSAKYLQRGLDFDRLIFPDQKAKGGGSPTTEERPLGSKGSVDGGASLMVYSPGAWVGFSADHLTRPDVSLYSERAGVPVKYQFFGGYKMPLLGKTRNKIPESITWAFNYRHQGGFNQLDVGGYYGRAPFVFGVWYRGLPVPRSLPSRDAVTALIGYSTDRFMVVYSYDLTVSKLVGASRGAHEVALMYRFKIKAKKKVKPLPCPHFWW